MNYKKIYNQIIERAQNRKLEEYKEKHHILPKCMGGSNKKENLVELTAREHFLCHMLLCEIYPKEIKLKHALFLMNVGIVKNDYSPSSRVYNRLKKERSKLIKGDKSIIGKKIIQYDLDGNFINIWSTIKYVSLKLNIHDGDICSVCRGKQKTAGKFQWRYYIDNFPFKIPSVTPYSKSDEFKLNQSLKLKGIKRSEDQIKHRYKPILQYDKQGNFIQKYKCIREACYQFGDNINKIESNIGACCQKKQKTAYGYVWKYKIV